MSKLNCPNCGAPITGIQCEYCGTRRKTNERLLCMVDYGCMVCRMRHDRICGRQM